MPNPLVVPVILTDSIFRKEVYVIAVPRIGEHVCLGPIDYEIIGIDHEFSMSGEPDEPHFITIFLREIQ